MGGLPKQVASDVRNHANEYADKKDDDIVRNDATSRQKKNDSRLPVQNNDTVIQHYSIGKGRKENKEQLKEEFTKAVESLFDHEEELLNLHMNIIQENAELLTEEGRLLQSIQGEDIMDYDIDAYCSRLAAIIKRKQYLNDMLRNKLQTFKGAIAREEELSTSMKGK